MACSRTFQASREKSAPPRSSPFAGAVVCTLLVATKWATPRLSTARPSLRLSQPSSPQEQACLVQRAGREYRLPAVISDDGNLYLEFPVSHTGPRPGGSSGRREVTTRSAGTTRRPPSHRRGRRCNSPPGVAQLLPPCSAAGNRSGKKWEERYVAGRVELCPVVPKCARQSQSAFRTSTPPLFLQKAGHSAGPEVSLALVR